jgi:hypothetical protein
LRGIVSWREDVAPLSVMAFTVIDGRIAGIAAVTDPAKFGPQPGQAAQYPAVSLAWRHGFSTSMTPSENVQRCVARCGGGGSLSCATRI